MSPLVPVPRFRPCRGCGESRRLKRAAERVERQRLSTLLPCRVTLYSPCPRAGAGLMGPRCPLGSQTAGWGSGGRHAPGGGERARRSSGCLAGSWPGPGRYVRGRSAPLRAEPLRAALAGCPCPLAVPAAGRRLLFRARPCPQPPPSHSAPTPLPPAPIPLPRPPTPLPSCFCLLPPCSHPTPTPEGLPRCPHGPSTASASPPPAGTLNTSGKTPVPAEELLPPAIQEAVLKSGRGMTREPGSPWRPSWAPGEWCLSWAWCCGSAHGSSWFILQLRGRGESLMGTTEGRR